MIGRLRARFILQKKGKKRQKNAKKLTKSIKKETMTAKGKQSALCEKIHRNITYYKIWEGI